MIRLLPIILLTTIFYGCEKKGTDIMKPIVPSDTFDTTGNNHPDTGKKISYLALGDSYTIGQSVPPEENFPNQLAARLNRAGYNVSSPVIIARTGWTTNDLITNIKSNQIYKKFDVVTLLIGVNNQYRGYNIDIYRTEFIELLHTAIDYADGNVNRVFVVSIPDYSVTPFAATSDKQKIADEINQYNAINAQESEKAGVNYTNITPISRQAVTDPSLIAPDGLHPSGKMYTQWINLLAPTVVKQIEK